MLGRQGVLFVANAVNHDAPFCLIQDYDSCFLPETLSRAHIIRFRFPAAPDALEPQALKL